MAETSQKEAWRTHHQQQRRNGLSLSYAERLRWLDNAKEFAQRALQAARARHAQRNRSVKTPVSKER